MNRRQQLPQEQSTNSESTSSNAQDGSSTNTG